MSEKIVESKQNEAKVFSENDPIGDIIYPYPTASGYPTNQGCYLGKL